MIKPLLTGTLILLSSTTLLAQNSNIEPYDEATAEKSRISAETKGLLGGALIGGLIAGPPGAIIAAAFGATMSNNNNAEKQKEQLQASLAQSQTELYVLQEQQRALEERYQLALEEKQNQSFMNVNLSETVTKTVTCCADTELVLHFKTNSSMVELHYRTQLEELASLSKSIPDAIIEITGYADRRGDNNTNLGLSQQRVNSIENSLLSMGVKRNIIQSNAFGENRPLSSTESLEGNFFDRRVNVKIRSANNDFLTQSE